MLYSAFVPAPPIAAPPVLATLSRRARQFRQEQGLTLRALADRSGVSLRFLMEVEAGRGNISIRRLANLAAALQTTASALIAEPAADDAGSAQRVIALLGLRGAGKTTVGKRLARKRRVPFVELDQRIESRAGLTLGEIFSLHGEEYYRRLERDVLVDLLSSEGPMVLAVGGGLVTAPETYALLRRQALTVWLKARPEDHWNRVVRQGDRRPMAQHPHARQALRELLDRREPLYARAKVTVETGTLTATQVVDRIEHAVGAA